MSSSTTETRARTEEFLKAYPGLAFCDECLSERVGVGLKGVRRTRVALAGSLDFDQQEHFCSVCLRIRHVIHVTWARVDVAWGDRDDDMC
jgi:hypothetical protein